MKNIISKSVALLFLASFISVNYTQAAFLTPVRVSVDDLGIEGDFDSNDPSVSGDGRYVVFHSGATNFVSDVTVSGNFLQVYLYDTENETVEIISRDGIDEGNGSSENPYISPNGEYVVFETEATNLVGGDVNGVKDIVLYNVAGESYFLVSVDSLGTQVTTGATQPVVSNDGSKVAFATVDDLSGGDSNGLEDVYMRDRDIDETFLISRIPADSSAGGNAASSFPSISSDGSAVTFYSTATNLVAGDTNSRRDIFLYDTDLNSGSEIVSLSDGEALGNNHTGFGSFVSADGTYVAFDSTATNLVTGDTNALSDVFIRNTTLDTTTRVNLTTAGAQATGGTSSARGMSFDGRFILMQSYASNLVSGDTNDGDYFLYDRITGEMDLVSVNTTIVDDITSLSADGTAVAFNSEATDIVAGDTNGVFDIFYAKMEDEDGISRAVEIASPNNGDIDGDGYSDAVQAEVTSFVSAVSSDYATVETTGNCTNNVSPEIVAEEDLADLDSSYEYPLGVFDFNISCDDSSGQVATVTLYYFEPTLSTTGLVARKYNSTSGLYTTVDSAVIGEETIGGERAITVSYDIVDGGDLDEDGLMNGTIVDPIGLGSYVPPAPTSSSGGSSGSRPKKALVAMTPEVQKPTDQKVCHTFVTPMKNGSKFGEVAKLQELLNSKGFSTGVADGLFGPKTLNAVKAFQNSNGLGSDGIVGPITRSALNKCN